MLEPQGGAFSVYLSCSLRQTTLVSYVHQGASGFAILFSAPQPNSSLFWWQWGVPEYNTVSCPSLSSALDQSVSLGKSGYPTFPQWLKAFVVSV